MNKQTVLWLGLTLSGLMGCSGERAADTAKAPDSESAQIGVKASERETVLAEDKAPAKRPEQPNQIVCDKFDLVTKVTSTTLEFSIDTDLPDDAIVSTSVSRSYFEKGNSTRYSVDYFSERSTIGERRAAYRVSIAHERWTTALRAKQEKMVRFGLGFEVASISDEIELSIVFPVNQPEPKFGNGNENLIGKAVNAEGLRIVEAEFKIHYPLNASTLGPAPVNSPDAQELGIGRAYVVSEQTPLMPSHSPADPLEALEKMKQIPTGGGFMVIEIYTKNFTPWYRVNAFDQRRKDIGSGWVNSTALLGQQLRRYQ